MMKEEGNELGKQLTPQRLQSTHLEAFRAGRVRMWVHAKFEIN